MWDFREKISLSKIQTIIGLTAGILSITFSLVAFFKPASTKAELVVIVQDGKTQMVVSDATIEILTPGDTLVSTLRPDPFGTAHFKSDEGRYRLRVNQLDIVRSPRCSTNLSRVQRFACNCVARAFDGVRRLFHR
jgi:hypothetical protein